MHGSSAPFIIKDEITNVSYLALRHSSGVALTPLLGAGGKPIIDIAETDLFDS